MTVTDELVQNNERYAEHFEKGDLPLPPAKGVAVVACMDARLHVSKVLGLAEGDAHIIRNAGGVVTDDEIRSLAISQRLLGTREIILIHHTDCGMLTFKDDEFRLDRHHWLMCFVARPMETTEKRQSHERRSARASSLDP